MPREYITNEIGHVSNYDIVIDNDIGLSFFGNTPVKGTFGPGELNQTNKAGEYPILFTDFSNGMGMAYAGIPNTYAFSINGYARTKKKFMPAGKLTELDLTELGVDGADLTAEIRGALEWEIAGAGDIYFGLGHHIVKWVGGYGSLLLDYDVGVDCQIDSGLIYNGVPLFSTDQSFDNWQHLTGHDGIAWKTANSDGSNVDYSIRLGAGNYEFYPAPVYLQKMKKFFQDVDGVGGNRIVGNNSFYTTIQTQATDIDTIIGDETAYLTPIDIGDMTYKIKNIFEANRFFCVAKADGVYGVESSGTYTPNYTQTWREAPSNYNGESGVFLQGKLWVATPEGVEMLSLNDKQRIDIPQLVSPSYFLANETPVFGIPTAMTVDNGWVVAMLWNGVDSHLCYLRPQEATAAEKTDTPVIWHGSECTIKGQRTTMMLKTNITGRPQMLIGTYDDVAERAHLYTLSLPSGGDPFTDYLNGDGHEFAEECRLYLPFQDAEDPNAKKFVRRYDIRADGLTVPVRNQTTGEVENIINAAQLDFYANADAGSRIFFETLAPNHAASEWEYQGIITTSPGTSMIPSTGATSGSQIGILVVGRLLDQGSGVYSPFAIRAIKIRADVSIEQIESKTYTVALTHLGPTRTGRDHTDPIKKFGSLVALQDADTVYMIDEHKERVLVKIEPGLNYYLRREDHNQPWTHVAEFEVTYIGRQFFYDVGHSYDSLYSWGS